MLRNDNVRYRENNGVGFVEFCAFDEYSAYVTAVFSTRKGGVSTGCRKSMNLSFNAGDLRENVLDNYRLFAEAVGADFRKVTLSDQHHSCNIRVITEKDAGKGITKERDYKNIDGLITNVKGIALATLHADCTPIYLYDSKNKAIGLAHAGWKGTAGEIAAKIVDSMSYEFGTRPEDLVVVIGPAICGTCYEVDADVAEVLSRVSINTSINASINTSMNASINASINTSINASASKLIRYDSHTGKYFPDLPRINREILAAKGVKQENICVTDVCTKENPDMFFSHRAHKDRRGGNAAMIFLKE